MESKITWFSVTDSLPFLGKKVLASDGETIAVSEIDSIMTHSTFNGKNDNWEVHWQYGFKATHWSFLPELPVAIKANTETGGEISIL